MKFAHLSDLHFGRRVSNTKLESLASDILSQAPELIVITGDITDRGRVSQFQWASDFLKSLQVPFITVPGNREISFSAIWEWMLPPLAMRRYRSFFGASDRVLYHCPRSNTVFFGLNSVHKFPAWPGTVARESRYWLKSQSARFSGWTKVLCVHHPVLPVIRASSFWAHCLSDAGALLDICTQTGIGLILQGHKHRSAVMELHVPERQARVVISSCGAPLSPLWDSVYHLIEIYPSTIRIQPREFIEGEFIESAAYNFAVDGPGG